MSLFDEVIADLPYHADYGLISSALWAISTVDLLGAGSFSSVYAREGEDTVIKVSSHRDSGYMSYVEFLKTAPDSSLWPKIYRSIRFEKCIVYEMERLQDTYKVTEDQKAAYVAKVTETVGTVLNDDLSDLSEIRGSVSQWRNTMFTWRRRIIPEMKAFTDHFLDRLHHLDFRKPNFLIRVLEDQNVELVMTDPLSEGDEILTKSQCFCPKCSEARREERRQ